MSDRIAIMIKTFFKEKTLFNTVKAIENYLDGISYRLYIADDSYLTEEKIRFYESLRRKDHCIAELPFNTGATRSRNYLLELLRDEEYVLRMDDDFEISSETNIPAMIAILTSESEIGAIADLERQFGANKGVRNRQISSWQGLITIRNKTLVKKMIPLKRFEYYGSSGRKFAYADFTRNMLLIKRELFDTIKWEEKLMFAGEHLDFLLQIKNSKWKLVFTTASTHNHREDIEESFSNERYTQTRNSNNASSIKAQVFKEKWGIERMRISRPISSYPNAILAKLTRTIANVMKEV